MGNEEVYYYNGEDAGNIDFVLDAVTGFKHLKEEKRKR